MNNFIKHIILMCAGALAMSCSNSLYQVNRNSVRLNPQVCDERSDRVDLFFEGETINFTYTRLAYVEVEGEDEDESINKIISELKYEAWKNGANGIINIKSEFKKVWINDNYYNKRLFSGIAIKANKDDAYVAKYSAIPDTSFLKDVMSDEGKERKKKDQQNGAAAVLFISLLIAAGLSGQ